MAAEKAAFLVALLCCILVGTEALSASRSLKQLPSERNQEQELLVKRWLAANSMLGQEEPTAEAKRSFEWTAPQNIAALIAAFACALLANSAGIGGGPFYVPLFNTVLGFDLQVCTALSHTVVTASAIFSSLYGVWARNPEDPSSPLIDFPLALTFIPALLLGVSFGVLFNGMVPEWLKTVLLTLLLIYVIQRTFKKGLQAWCKEEQEKEKKKAKKENATPADGLLDGASHESPHSLSGEEYSHWSDEDLLREALAKDEALAQIIDEPECHQWHCVCAIEHFAEELYKRIPFIQVLELVALWGAFLLLQLLKTQFDTCTWQYAAAFAGQLVLLASATIANACCLLRQAASNPERVDVELRRILLDDQGACTAEARREAAQRLAWVTCVMVFAGFLAGLLGIGGALIFNPFLLQLGVHPQVVASTAVVMILFSSSSIALSFAFQGMLPLSYAAVFAPATAIGGFLGVTVTGYLLRKYGRPSIIIFVMAGIITAGMLATAIFGGINSVQDIQAGEAVGFGSFCDS